MKAYQIYLFDLDGTITDTAMVWIKIFRECLAEQGITGLDDVTIAAHTHNWAEVTKLGVQPKNLPTFIAQAHQLAHARLSKSPFHKNVYETLRTLHDKGKRTGLYTTMDRALLEPVLTHRQLHNVMDVAVSGTDVERRKPHPDGILKALNDLGVSRAKYQHAVYIGDRDTDIQAAHNAGIAGVLFYPASHQLFYSLDELTRHNPAAVITAWDEILAPLALR